MYSCVLRSAIIVGCPKACETKYYYNTFYPFVEQADCNAGANNLVNNETPAYRRTDMGTHQVDNGKVYGRFAHDLAWGETHLIQYNHKSYQDAQIGESFGYLSSGGQDSNCRKAYGSIGTDSGMGWSQTCSKIAQCNNGF
ncbi:hypothetical protein HDV02_003408 [Globomyces sp. JEL0801]|nr:hypothetical protein HDV02_003408 [Globomyces sp. JEL0801]